MTHETLLAFFHKVLNQDAATIEKIAHFKGDLFIDQERESLIFSLPSLHALLFDKQGLSFPEFKKALYQGKFNQALKTIGGVVSVYQSNGKITDSLYQLNLLVNK
ncbi:MAG: hypothetical protein ACJAWS_001375 [Oleiphilaceae bacterium]|jgi:hypothetical protein